MFVCVHPKISYLRAENFFHSRCISVYIKFPLVTSKRCLERNYSVLQVDCSRTWLSGKYFPGKCICLNVFYTLWRRQIVGTTMAVERQFLRERNGCRLLVYIHKETIYFRTKTNDCLSLPSAPCTGICLNNMRCSTVQGIKEYLLVGPEYVWPSVRQRTHLNTRVQFSGTFIH
jgi:hypothetical protein